MGKGPAVTAVVEFVPTDPVTHHAELITLNVEYIDGR